jgi:hypothetical protein
MPVGLVGSAPRKYRHVGRTLDHNGVLGVLPEEPSALEVLSLLGVDSASAAPTWPTLIEEDERSRCKATRVRHDTVVLVLAEGPTGERWSPETALSVGRWSGFLHEWKPLQVYSQPNRQ